MSNPTKSVKNVGIFSLIISIFFLAITIACVVFIIGIHNAIKNEDSIAVIFLIILAIVIYFVLGIVGLVSLVLSILNLSTGIIILKNSNSYDKLYQKKGRIKFSIFILAFTSFVFFIAGVGLIFSLFSEFTVASVIIAVIMIALGCISFILSKKAHDAFKEIIEAKEAESIN
ncbi:MAG: hypothetical protein K6E20_04745 [Acholeplasmatales bacterium]|nr:hypothetical protein [Acholeplasmatales bacterium]